jgi:hypothetical protein
MAKKIKLLFLLTFPVALVMFFGGWFLQFFGEPANRKSVAAKSKANYEMHMEIIEPEMQQIHQK